MPIYIECGCCGHLHRPDYHGDCRNDAERFTFDDLDRLHGEGGYETVDTYDEELSP